MVKKINKPKAEKSSEPNDGEEEMTPVERWIEEIQLAKDANRPYWDLCDTIIKKYKDDSDFDSSQKPESKKERKYNVLWSITQTMQPLVYSHAPKPYVSRKHSDKDSIARDASLTLERTLAYELEGDELHMALKESRDDYILCSRGVIWPKYTPYMKLRKSDDKTYFKNQKDVPEGSDVLTDEQGRNYFHKTYEEKIFEEVDWEHVHYRDFLHGAAAKWRHVPWVARRVPMTRKELIKRFGEKVGKLPPLTIHNKRKGSDSTKTDGDEAKGMFAKAEVWEIWDKCEGQVIWLCPQHKDRFLDKQEDFLELDGFFPCPMPAYGTKTNESLIPTPDYKLWQDIAIELDEVTWRIKLLTESLRVVGVYDKSMGEIVGRLTKHTRENEMIAVDSWAMFAEKGGLKGAVEFLPVDQIAGVLEKMHGARQRLLAELYDITGVSDIVRGASDPRETAKAQQIKGQFANKRLSTRQEEMMRMAREALEIQSQIICNQYSPETIKMVSSAEQTILNPETQQFDERRFMQAIMLLKSNPLRRFRIKIDEKSLAMPDINDDQQQRMQFVQSISSYLTAATQMMMAAPASGPLLGEILLWAVRGFPLARSEEAGIENAMEKLLGTPMPQEQKEQPKPTGKSPEELQLEAQKLFQQSEIDKGRLELDTQKALFEKQLDQARLEFEKAFKQRELELKEQKQASDAQYQHEQLNAQREAQQTQAGLELGRLQTTAAIDMRKQEAESSLRREEIGFKGAVEREKLDQSALKDERDAQMSAQNQSASQAQFQEIMTGLAQIMQESQRGSSGVAQSLEKILATITKQQDTLNKTLTAPRRVVRDASGKVERMEIGA